jgi:hypothetical protein
MRIERSAQGISFQCKKSIGHYFVYLGLLPFFFCWAKVVAFFVQGFLVYSSQDMLSISIVGVGVLLVVPVLWGFVREGLREFRKMEVRSGLFEFSTRSLTLQLQNSFGQKQILNCGVGDVQDVEVFYSRVPIDGEGACGLRLKVSQSEILLYLSSGGMSLEEVRSIAQEFESYFGLPEKPPLCGYSSDGGREFKQHILEKSEHHLVYRLNQSNYLWKLFIAIELSFLALFTLATSGAVMTPFLLIFALPLGLQFLLMKMMGYCETWTWDRSSGQFRVNRKRLIGVKKQVFFNQDVKAVVLQTRPGTLTTPTHYHVGLDLPVWGSRLTAESANPVRIIYSSQRLEEAIDFAEELRHYLGMQPE